MLTHFTVDDKLRIITHLQLNIAEVEEDSDLTMRLLVVEERDERLGLVQVAHLKQLLSSLDTETEAINALISQGQGIAIAREKKAVEGEWSHEVEYATPTGALPQKQAQLQQLLGLLRRELGYNNKSPFKGERRLKLWFTPDG